MSVTENEAAWKVMLIGEGATGKTCMLDVYKSNKFPTTYIPTIIDNFQETVEVNGKKINLAIWDSSGQENYAAVRQVTYSDTEVIVICFAIDDLESFNMAKSKWYEEVINLVPTADIVLVGLKSDLRKTGEKNKLVDASQAEDMAAEMKARFYMECSALENKNVREVFQKIADFLVKKKAKREKKSWLSYLWCC